MSFFHKSYFKVEKCISFIKWSKSLNYLLHIHYKKQSDELKIVNFVKPIFFLITYSTRTTAMKTQM